MKTKIRLSLVFEKSIEIDFQKFNLILDVIPPFNHHIIQLYKYFIKVLDIFILCFIIKNPTALIQLSKFITQFIKLIDFIYPESLEFLTCSCHFFVQHFTFSHKILEVFVICQVMITERY